ncbi:MAG: hypothetical protein KatS3mg104_2840 [Phycisphaerae bacterium]|jgi:hypothetical protein|nr:MAG: hypothetical protein KatS3mg104_2840 [Phycisphaerae bacterium]
MSDTPIIQVDSDWKRQAQEEKRKLAEQTASKTSKAPVSPSVPRSDASGRSTRQLPEAGFASIVQSIMTQALYYLGEIGDENAPPMLNLDLAKYQIDMLGVLEEKTKGNLTREEQTLLDQTVYDLRSRYVSIARQLIM